jgi:hypothetical protein
VIVDPFAAVELPSFRSGFSDVTTHERRSSGECLAEQEDRFRKQDCRFRVPRPATLSWAALSLRGGRNSKQIASSLSGARHLRFTSDAATR